MSLIKNLAIAATVIGVAACTAFVAPKVSRVLQLKKLFKEMGGEDFIKGATTDVEKKMAVAINQLSSEYILSGSMESYGDLEAMCLTLKAHFAERAETTAAAATADQPATATQVVPEQSAGAASPANDSNKQDAAAA